jgi:hypothetical protein
MEKVLIKLARQLNAFDEASLISLWEKYAETVQHFEPTKRWEEAALVFGFIQSVRWKNQLFNYNWAQNSKPREGGPKPVNPFADLTADPALADNKPKSGLRQKLHAAQKTHNVKKSAKVLRFKTRDNEQDPQDA